jgi:lipoprotein-anchoring transpeptidase ErfK/SrfK
METPMSTLFSRRHLMLGGLALLATGHAARAGAHPLYGGADPMTDPSQMAPWQTDPSLLPPKESETDFPVPEVNPSIIPAEFRRQIVPNNSSYKPGTVIVDPAHRFLYLVQDQSTAIRYGVGVGRAGFAWSGTARVGMKRRWPRWVPPVEMVQRDERAAKWPNGMPGGPDNPLGARALYLFVGNEDTLYRIHGTNEPKSIGTAVSSGCVRMLNQDIAELFDLVPVGAPVEVLAGEGI